MFEKMKLRSHSPSLMPPELNQPPTLSDIYDLIHSKKMDSDKTFSNMDTNFGDIATTLDNINANVQTNAKDIKQMFSNEPDKVSQNYLGVSFIWLMI